MKAKAPGVDCDPSDLVLALKVISGKWKVRIIWHLLNSTKRFNQLHRLLPGISRGTLTFELRQLQQDGIIDRTQYLTIPPTVEYKLTPNGRELRPILGALHEWSRFLAEK
jgi:DNA-binding HxlR family transcriptional regulator